LFVVADCKVEPRDVPFGLSARADTVDRRINAVSGSRSVGAAAGREGVP